MRGFAPDLDLTGLFDTPYGPPAAVAGLAPDGTFVLVVGTGPAACSSSRELAVRTVHDVNGYYAALGVPNSATRGQISAAYVALGGHASSRLTMILTVLLDRVSRSVYNGLPLGQRYLDHETEADLSRADSVWKLKNQCINSSETAYGIADDAPYWKRLRHSTPGGARPGWGYAHYQWGALPPADRNQLAAWQHLLIRALDGTAPLTFAVGSSRNSHCVIEIDRTPVAFLPHGTPATQEEATRAAHRLRTLAPPTNTAPTDEHATRTDPHQGASTTP